MRIEVLEQQLQDTKIELVNERASHAKLMDNRILEQTILEAQLVSLQKQLHEGMQSKLIIYDIPCKYIQKILCLVSNTLWKIFWKMAWENWMWNYGMMKLWDGEIMRQEPFL